MLIANQDLQVADHTAFLQNTAFAAGGPSVQAIVDLGFYPVTVWLDHDRETQKLVPAAPYLTDGVCFTVAVEEKTAEELQADTDSIAVKVRADRNARLAACDWTQLADSTADKAAWATYRQALRDVSAQSGFPKAVEWPETPTSN
jgi:hypothetical protein